MNILLLDLHCDALLPSGAGEFGGGNTYSKSLLNLISNNKDINCLYITRKKTNSLQEEFNFSSNIRFIRIKIGDYNFNDKDTIFLHTESTFNTIQKLLKNHNFSPDIIHSSYWPSGLVSLKLSSIYDAKQIHTVLSNGKRKMIESGHYDIEDIRIQSEQDIYKKVDYVICSSKAEYQDIKKLYKISSEKLVLTGLDVDDSFLFPSYKKDGSFLLNSSSNSEKNYLKLTNYEKFIKFDVRWWNNGAFLFYGRLHEDKGIVQIIECWLELFKTHHNISPLWIVGGSPEQILEIRKKIDDSETLKKAENMFKLIWWGRLSFEGISTLLLKCLVVVTHSRYEAGGLMVLETMAAGKPVIATPNGFAKDCIIDWENGFIVGYNNLVKLKLRMLNFHMQPLLSAELGKNASDTFFIINKTYGFRNKHLKLYGIENIANNSDLSYKVNNPYPLCEILPTDNDVLRSFYNIYSKQNIVNYSEIAIERIKFHSAYLVWKLKIRSKVFYCIRWRNHYNFDSVFFQNESLSFSAYEQFTSNIYFLKTNNKNEKYYDESSLLIFVCSDNTLFAPLSQNFDTIFITNHSLIENVKQYTHENIIFEIKDMLNNYDFFFNQNCDIINKILGRISIEPTNQSELVLFPKYINETFTLDNSIIFSNKFILVEKEYVKAIFNNSDNQSWNALIKCREIMIRSIIDGKTNDYLLERILKSLE